MQIINVKQRIFQNAWGSFRIKKKLKTYSNITFQQCLIDAHRTMKIYLNSAYLKDIYGK